jgi:hypothetical protein
VLGSFFKPVCKGITTLNINTTKKKSFIELTTEVNVIKLFFLCN